MLPSIATPVAQQKTSLSICRRYILLTMCITLYIVPIAVKIVRPAEGILRGQQNSFAID